MGWGVLLLLWTGAHADRLILTPTAYNLPPGSLKIEVARRESQGGLTYYWAHLGLVGGIEVEVARQQYSERRIDSLSLQYNLLPDIGFTPALSFGLRDLADKTDEGFSLYLAVGHRLPYMPPNPFIEEMYLFGGVGGGGIRGLFVGTQILTPYRLLLTVEYDSRRWNAALSWQPTPFLRLSLYRIDGENFYGASLTTSL